MIKIQIEKKLIGAQKDFTLSINKQIDSGDFVAIFGKSGAGKTTILRILAGLEQPEKGIIQVEDKVWVERSEKKVVPVKNRNIGFVAQQSILFPNMNVKEQLTFSKGINTDLRLLEEVVSIMKIDNLLSANPNKLSGGQKQRISLARAIIQKPKILLLDEPFVALDYGMKQELIQLTKKITNQYKITTIFVSHDPVEIIQLANRIWVLENGRIQNDGNPKDLLSNFLNSLNN